MSDRPATPGDPHAALSDAGRGRLFADLDNHLLGGLLDPARPFGPFRMLGELGRGRFGVVLHAADTRTGREVAIKVPLSSARIDPESVRLIGRDVEAGVLLDHPGILPVLEAGSIDGQPYLVTPYVPGPTLAGWLAAHPGPVPAADAVRLALALADATAHAHERGVLHCDLKPGNILLQPAGGAGAGGGLTAFAPRITDFGLARLLTRPDADTRTHLAAGTPPYMAPEQAMGTRRGLTARCDVHGLAAVLYELLSGTPPYGEPGGEDALMGLLDRERRPAPLPGVPRDLEAVVLKGLEKDPAARYANAAEFAADLRRWREGRPTRARPVGPLGRAWRWGRRRPVTAAGTALLVAALVAGAYFATETARARDVAARRDFYARLERVRRRAVERPDGWAEANLAEIRQLAATPTAPDELPELRTQAAAALAEPTFRRLHDLAPGKNAYVVAFSPDGATVALGERYPVPEGQGKLRVWLTRSDTGEVQRTLGYPVDTDWEKSQDPPRADGARSLLFAPDGQRLFAGTRSRRVVTWHIADPDPEPRMRQLRARGTSKEGRDEVVSLNVNPAGTVVWAGLLHGGIESWEPASGRTLGLNSGWLPVSAAARRERAWYHGQGLWYEFDLTTGDPTHSKKGRTALFAQSPGGDSVVLADNLGGFNGWMMNPIDPGGARPLPGPAQTGALASAAFSPDGRLIAVSSESPPAVELRDALSRQVVTRRPYRGGSGRLAFSPDGRLLAVCEQERTLLYEARPSRAREAATAEPFEIGSFALSRDGRTLATLESFGASPPGVGPGANACTLTVYRRTEAGLVESERVGVLTPYSSVRQIAMTPRGDGHVFGVFSNMPKIGGTIRGVNGTIMRGLRSATRVLYGPHSVLWVADNDGLLVHRPGVKGQVVYRFTPEENRAGVHLTALELYGEDRILAGRRDGLVIHLDQAGRVLGKWQTFDEQGVRCLAVPVHDERLVLVGGLIGDLAVVRPDSGTVTRPAERPHREAVTGVAWLPGRAFVTASADNTIRLWAGLDEPVLMIRESGPIEQAELRGGRLYVRVRGDWGVRVHRLDRLAEQLRDLGLDPGFRVEADDPPYGSQDGLQLSVYADTSFDWLTYRRKGPTVACVWDARPPSFWTPPGLFSARWEGRLKAPRPGRWEFTTDSDGSIRAWVGGRPLFGTGDFKSDGDGVADLPTGPVPFRLDFMRQKWGGRCRLLWRPEGDGDFVPVPPEAFSGP